MNAKRFLAAAASAAMLSTVPVALTASSASAATTVESRVIIDKTSSVYTYNRTVTISGAVQGKHPSQGWGAVADTDGTVKLYRRLQPYTTYKLVATDTTEASFNFKVPAASNATYRVVYSGGSNGTYTFKPNSNWRAIKVRRDAGAKIVKSSSGRVYMKGNVDPGWAYKSVKIVRSRYSTGTYSTYKYAKTNRYGAYQASVVAPSSGRYYYRVIIASSEPQFVQTTSPTWYTYKTY